MHELKFHDSDSAILPKIMSDTLYCSQICSLKYCVNLKEEPWILYIFILNQLLLFTITPIAT